MNKTRKRPAVLILAILIGGVFFLLVQISVGTITIPLDEVFRFFTFQKAQNATFRMILADIRLPRLLVGFFIGSILSLSGVFFQALLKNPLADPYILGVSSGGAFGTVLSIALFGTATAVSNFMSNLPVMSFLFSLFAALLTYLLAKKGTKVPVVDLILSGVIMNFFFSAATTFVVIYGWRNVHSATFWLLGSLSGARWEQVLPLMLIAGFGLVFGLGFSKTLNAISLGEEEAKNIGIEVEKVKFALFITGTLMAAYTITVTGIVGFVGLVIPHTSRILVGSNHRRSLPMSVFLGGLFFTGCDTVARTLFQPTEMPLGTITSLIGAPIFALILKKARTVR
jgi:iron complex transport system permease protein